MRPLLLAAAALTSATLLEPATACGVPTPRVFLLSSHTILDGEQATHRTFALLHREVPNAERQPWRMLAPMSYDGTRIANAPPLYAAIKLTLVGEKGTKVVTSRQQAFLEASWQFRAPTAALEVKAGPESQFRVAVAGTHSDLGWDPIAQIFMLNSERDASRLDSPSVYDGGDHLHVISGWDTKAGASGTVLMNGTTEIGRYTGSPIGVLRADGFHYLLLESDGVVTPVMI